MFHLFLRTSGGKVTFTWNIFCCVSNRIYKHMSAWFGRFIQIQSIKTNRKFKTQSNCALLAKKYECLAKGKTSDALKKLVELTPRTTLLVVKTEKWDATLLVLYLFELVLFMVLQEWPLGDWFRSICWSNCNKFSTDH